MPTGRFWITCPREERQRLHHAVAQVFNPDPVARRRRLKAAERQRSAAKMERVGAVLHETGIRSLRRQPVFTTPNFFPPENFRKRRRMRLSRNNGKPWSLSIAM